MPVKTRPSKVLSDNQAKALEFIESYVTKNGYAPSTMEISSALGAKSNGSGFAVLVGLETKGFIERIPGVARGLRILKHPTK